jgi:RNA recognition motif-containing protein
MKNIFCANIPYRVTELELSDCFGQYGAVEKVWIVRDRDTKQSRGFAFVEMSDDSAAQMAIADLNGREWDGRIIRVREADDRNRATGNRFQSSVMHDPKEAGTHHQPNHEHK